jgi:hypothetical protein
MSTRVNKGYKLQSDEIGTVVNNQYNNFSNKSSIADLATRLSKDLNGENLIMFVFVLFVGALFFSFLYFQV